MKNKLIADFTADSFASTKTHPKFRSGDTVSVHYRIKDGDKERVQRFEGVCLRYRKGGEGDSSFTVRHMGANSVGVERVFPYFSPNIERIDVISPGSVRRSRIYYLRKLTGKAARISTRRLPEGTITTTVDSNEQPKVKKPKKSKKTKKIETKKK